MPYPGSGHLFQGYNLKVWRDSFQIQRLLPKFMQHQFNITSSVINDLDFSVHGNHLAYGGWARSTSVSQNWAVLPERHDSNLFFRSQLAKIKTMFKLLWLLLIVNLRILGSVSRGTEYFFRNRTTIILPGDIRQITTFGAKLETLRWLKTVSSTFHDL